VLTLSQSLNDKGEVQESEEDHIEFLEAGEEAAEALQSTEEALNLVALLVESAVVLPGVQPVSLGRDNGKQSQLERELAGLVAFVGAVHHQGQPGGHRPQCFEQRAALRRIMRLARREGEGYGCSSIRGNQMNLGVPSAARLADGLRSVFFKAPVPSG
jgi:hypothetical protein